MPTLHALLLLASLLPAPSPQDPSGGARLVLETLEGVQRSQPPSTLTPADLREGGTVFLHYEGLAAPPPAGAEEERAILTLHGGERLSGWIAGGDGERLDLALARGFRLPIGIESLASLVVPGRLPQDGSSVPEPPQEGDRLYVLRGGSGDRVDGVLIEFDGKGVRFEGRLGEHLYPWSEVAALFVEYLEEEAPEDGGGGSAGSPAEVDLVGGGRLAGDLLRVDAEGVTLRWGAAERELPAALVREVALQDPLYRFLSELPVSDGGPIDLFGGSDELGMVYPHRKDRNCLGAPLVCAGRTWSRGIGVHAPSRLTWKLEGGYRRLHTWFGVDDSVLANRHRGSVIFRIHADGKVLWESPLTRGGDPPQEVNLDLRGVEELVLEVDPASEAFVSDRADWLRPILLTAE